jgi:hypothetical protein
MACTPILIRCRPGLNDWIAEKFKKISEKSRKHSTGVTRYDSKLCELKRSPSPLFLLGLKLSVVAQEQEYV